MDIQKIMLKVINKEQEQIIDEVYEKYSIIAGMSTQVVSLTKDSFIHYIKTDVKFSETWGLKIEERDLDLEERSIIAGSNHNEVSQNIKMFTGIDEDHTLHKNLDDNKIPTKLITLTYNNETIESYE